MITLEFDDDGFVGLIVPARTGIIYRNQTGGTCCQHPALEGWFWPMNWRTWEAEQESALCDWGLDVYDDGDREALDSALEKWDLEQIFRAPTRAEVDEQLRPFHTSDLRRSEGAVEFGEAWVPVCVREAPDDGGFVLNGGAPPEGHVGRCMILTYPNSD